MTDAQLGCWDNARRIVQERLGVVRHRASADALVIQRTFQVSAEDSRPKSMTAR
jgi:hypothetical protein